MLRYNKRNSAVLVLEDGSVYKGLSIGKIGTTSGEICFNTTMTGYQETYTDPSYCGQILVATAPHIGNYGVTDDEVESDSVKIAGLVCNKFTIGSYSRDLASGSLQDLFEKENVVGISDIDTRSLVRHIRNKGAMNAIISSENRSIDDLKKQLAQVPSMEGLELSSKVTTRESYFFGKDESIYKVAVLDFGVKRNILRCLSERNCYLKVFPSTTQVDEIIEWQPDGIMLSNGPGDPSAMKDVIATVKKLIMLDIPVFGICLGHQILALANGLSTYKMHNGHRGANHPVKNLLTGKCEVTSQNHGFVVDLNEVENNEKVKLTHIHLNDNTLAGFQVKNKKIFSVQYHPESSAGPNDSRYLFDQFIENIRLGIKERSLTELN